MARPRMELEDMNFDGWAQLEALAVWGSAEFCATKLGMSPDSLDRRLKEKYGHGFAEYKHKIQEPLRINLMKKQYDVAMGGNTAMLIWLGKQYLNQSDKQETALQTKIQINIDKDDSNL